MKNITCPHCNKTMDYFGMKKIQLGEYGILAGSLSNLFSGSLKVEIYICSNCGKLEFFHGDAYEKSCGSIAQVLCRSCGKKYDIDSPNCPHCGSSNQAISE